MEAFNLVKKYIEQLCQEHNAPETTIQTPDDYIFVYVNDQLDTEMLIRNGYIHLRKTTDLETHGSLSKKLHDGLVTTFANEMTVYVYTTTPWCLP